MNKIGISKPGRFGIVTRTMVVFCAVLTIIACSNPSNAHPTVPAPDFEPVTDISGVPTAAGIGVPLVLTGTVIPENATKQDISWSVKSGSAEITGNSLIVNAAGTVVVTATVANGISASQNYTKDFSITASVYVAFTGLVADGSADVATTKLTLTFGEDIPGLTETDITLIAGDTGVVKGALTGTETAGVYELALTDILRIGEVTVEVSKTGYFISPASKTVTVYTTGSFSITFTEIADSTLSIIGPTLYRVSNGGPTSATLTIDNHEQYGSISWQVQNTVETGSGQSFTLSAANSAYHFIGEHFVTVSVTKNNVPYNKTVSFKIEY